MAEALAPKGLYPVTSLELVLKACNPGEPLEPNDPRYADFTRLRQGVGLGKLKKELRSLEARGPYHHGCLCGHRGSGKSTEMLRLKDWADKSGFLAVRTEVDAKFGMIELEFSDLFLLVATAVEEAMETFGHPLSQEKIGTVVRWFADVIKEDKQSVQSEIAAEVQAQLGSGFSIAKFVAKLTAGVKAASSHATTTRQKLRNFPDTLIDMTNDLLAEANATLTVQGRPNGLLLLFDNLDRYDPQHIDRVLFRSSELVNRMACHAIFTIPIALEYDPPSGPIQDCYGFSVVLPMLALRRKTDLWKATVAEGVFNADAIKTVRDALNQRIEVDALFANLPDADLLIKMSGGCIRDLMHLITLAFGYTEEDDRFTTESVQKAIRDMRATYIRRLDGDDYKALAAIARREPIWPDDEKKAKEIKSRLLFHRFALEYLDEEDVPWIDVHPLVVEIEEFRRACASRSAIAKK